MRACRVRLELVYQNQKSRHVIDQPFVGGSENDGSMLRRFRYPVAGCCKNPSTHEIENDIFGLRGNA